MQMNCQVRRVVTLGILPTFPCPGKGLESSQYELDAERVFRLTKNLSSFQPKTAECGLEASAFS